MYRFSSSQVIRCWSYDCCAQNSATDDWRHLRAGSFVWSNGTKVIDEKTPITYCFYILTTDTADFHFFCRYSGNIILMLTQSINDTFDCEFCCHLNESLLYVEHDQVNNVMSHIPIVVYLYRSCRLE